MSEVTVVIGNHNGEHLLPDCIASIREQSLEPRAILVMDGASTDRSNSVTTELGAQFVAESNVGLGYLYNRGVGRAETIYVFLANNDIALMPDCLERLSAALDADPTAFAADARQLDWSGEVTIHAHTTLRSGPLFHEYLPGLHLDDNVAASHVTPTLAAHGAAMMVRRSMFLELGGFDETFFMEWEDLDLCWRAWYRGWPSVYVPDAVVRHRVGAATSAAAQPRRSTSSHHNLMRFALKCLPGKVAARVLLGEVLRLPAHPRAIGFGGLRVIAEAPEIRRFRTAHPPSATLLASLTEPSTATSVASPTSP